MDISRRACLAAVPASAAASVVAAGLVPTATGDDEGAGNWEPLGRLRLTGATEAVASGETAYVATVDGFAVADVSDPAEPELLAERRGFRVADDELLADDGGGSDTGEDEDSTENTEGNETAGAGDDGTGEDGDPNGNETDEDDSEGTDENDGPRPFTEILDLSVEGDRLVIPGPANPGQDVFSGIVLYDVSDPADPQPLATYETDFHIHNATLDGGYCYLVGNDGERNPLVILDVTGDEPREVGRWSLLEHEPRWEEVDSLLWYLHDVTLSGDIAVLAYWNAGTYLVDVSDPAAPEYVGHVAESDVEEQLEFPPTAVTEAQQTLPGNDHHARLEGDLLAVGREAWAAEEGESEGSGGIDLYDASDPEEIEGLATIEAPPTEDASYRGGEWTTAHNFSLRDDRLYASWYRGGVSVHDVSDPANPAELARWEDRERAAFWTAHAVGEIIVAPSTPLVPNAPTEGALYTFPASVEGADDEEADVGASDDGSEDAGAEGDENETDEEGEDDENEPATETEDGETDGGDGADSAPDDRNESAAGADADADTDDGGGLSVPGIGVVAAGGVAVAGAAALAWSRLRGSDDDSDEGSEHR